MTSATYEFQSDFARRYFHEGKAEGIALGKAEGIAEGKAEGTAEGEARALLTVLEARGIEVPDAARQRITGCGDPDLIESWIRRATTASTIDEVFG